MIQIHLYIFWVKLSPIISDIKLPDALQLAAGIECSCDVFLTNDKQLRQVQEANVLYLADLD